MSDQTPEQTDGKSPERTGEEKTIRDELNEVDKEVGNPIKDLPGGTREEKRRSKFIDLYGDEDNDPNTDEATYRRKQQGS